MSSSPDDTPADGSSRASSAALPTFTPYRDNSRSSVRAGSSASGSRRSGIGSIYDEHSQPSNELSNGSSVATSKIGHPDEDHHRRTRPRGSGGFLLDNAFPPTQLSRTLFSRTHQSQQIAKGKRRSEDAELVVPKRRLRDIRNSHRASVGSSPLAIEVQNAREIAEACHNGPPSPSHDLSPEQSFQTVSENNDPRNGHSSTEVKRSTSRIGFDTDPAQIVSMALSLSEGRRMQASGLRLISGQVAGQRGASSAPPQQGPSLPSMGSIGQYLTPQRQTSRNISPRSALRSPKLNGGSTKRTSRVFLSSPIIEGGDDFEQDTPVTLSEATAKRVQKAKTYFELAFEHRRLLSHLPPIRKTGEQLRQAPVQGTSKVYNPLQYARNRKLRFRERALIAAELEGWHDVLQVRAWVDAVIATHHDTRHDPDECIRLPELDHHKQASMEDTEEDSIEVDAPATRQISKNQNARPKMSRSDWVNHPGDLIADAFWLEQGLNKTKIEDRDGNRIYPSDTQFKFSGWRNRTPMHIPPALQEHTPPPEPVVEEKEDSTARTHAPILPTLPTFRSAQDEGRLRKGRGRRGEKQQPGTSKDGSGSRKRTAKIFNLANSSSSSSIASDSEDAVERRGRKRLSRKRQQKSRPAGGGVGNTASKEYQSDHSHGTSAPNSNRASMESSRIARLFTKDSMKNHASLPHSQTRIDSRRRDSGRPRGSEDSARAPRSSGEYDTTAPNSPIMSHFPSIAINLSPPQSRSPSPTKKLFQARLNPFRERSKHREGIDAADFAAAPQSSHHDTLDVDTGDDGSAPPSRGTSPRTRGTSPLTKTSRTSTMEDESPMAPSDHRDSTVSRISTKSGTPSIETGGRIRGMFKGGRIAELVGNEVNRVGDFIWKREIPSPHYRNKRSISTSSINSYHDSDTDEGGRQNGHIRKTPPRQHHRRLASYESTHSDTVSPPPSKSSPSSADQPQYHNPNLPTFTSPFQRDKDVQEEKKQTLLSPDHSPHVHDHISRAAAQHRSASRSPRLDLLAPPRLTISGPSTSPSPNSVLGRQESYGFGSQLELSRSRSATQNLNNALINNKPNGIPATGLASLRASRSGTRLTRKWTASSQSLDESDTSVVTRWDIARVSALLLTSAIKARGITFRAESVKEPTPKWVLATINSHNESSTPPRIKRKELHVVAARNLINTLAFQANQFQDRLHQFGNATTPQLHRDLQVLEDMVESTMTPRVRAAADEAGELSMKLTTTSTLAVKGLNDVISSAMRRRRRGPFRWLKRFGYKLVEVGVVGLLWGIWLVVTLLHAVWAVVRGMGRGMRWMLWVD